MPPSDADINHGQHNNNCSVETYENANCNSATRLTAASDLVQDTWELAAGSGAINAGSGGDDGTGLRATDLAGNPRIAFGVIDIGCFEVQTLSSVSVQLAQGKQTYTVVKSNPIKKVEFSAIVVAPAGETINLRWDFGDGNISNTTETATGDRQTVSVAHIYTAAGEFDISVTATVAGVSNTAESPRQVLLYYSDAFDIYVAPDGDDRNDGLTPETAKRSLYAASKVAPGGGILHLAKGRYTVEKDAEFSPYGICNDTGNPEDVVLTASADRTDTLTVGYGIKHVTVEQLKLSCGGTVENCVFQRYAANRGNWIVSLRTGAVARNCLFCDNSAEILDGGTAIDCVFTDNDIYSDGGIARNATLYRCRIVGTGKTRTQPGPLLNAVASDCLFLNNKGNPATAQESTTYNCTFVGNTGNRVVNGGQHYGGLFYNNPQTNAANDFNGAKFYRCIVPDVECSTFYACIKDDPQIDENGVPRAGSPAIDAGIAYTADGALSGEMPNAELRQTDITGKTKRLRGAALDIGCYEHASQGLIMIVK